jgi:membrane fusion protein (multidrug efflux system)
MIAGPAIVLAAVVFFLLTGGRYVSTDDAYVRADRVAISPSVSGRVTAVAVRENQQVKKGDVLLTLDAHDYIAAETQAEADLRNAQQNESYAAIEARRQKDLLAIGVASQADVDRAANAATQARLQAAALRAKLDVARKDVADAKVLAPEDGVVTKVSQVQVGAVVNAGQPLFFLVSGQPWVEANFKEDQLKHMRVGEDATVKIDAFSDLKIKARLKSFSPGTGSSFSLLPPENATGNWVKVSQRVPVEFELLDAPADLPMIAGLSANVKVDTKSGPMAKMAPAR